MDRIQGSPFPDLIPDDPEGKGIVHHQILTDTSHEAVIFLGSVQWSRVEGPGGIVHYPDPGIPFVGKAGLLDARGGRELSGYRYGVGAVDRDTNACAGNLQLWQSKDLSSLVHHLEFFPGVAALEELVDMRNDVEGDLFRIHFPWQVIPALGESLDLFRQLFNARLAAS